MNFNLDRIIIYVFLGLFLFSTTFMIGKEVGDNYMLYLFPFLPGVFGNAIINILFFSILSVLLDPVEIKYIWRNNKKLLWNNNIRWFPPPITTGFISGFVVSIILILNG